MDGPLPAPPPPEKETAQEVIVGAESGVHSPLSDPPPLSPLPQDGQAPSTTPAAEEPPTPVPKRRPPPPTKGILKPARQPQKSVFASFRPSQLVRTLVGDGDPPRPPPTAREKERDRLAALAQQAQGTTQAGAFFSRALGRLSMAAAGVVDPQQPASQPNGAHPQPSSSWSARSTTSSPSAPAPSSLPATPVPPPPVVEMPLKRAGFLLSAVSITYPISSALPPCSPAVSKSIEEIEANHLKRYNEEGGWQWWTGDRLVDLYERACKTREERPQARIRDLLNKAASPKPPAARVLDLSGIPLTRYSAEALADVLAVEWGLTKLVLDGCDLAEESLKPLLHALLISGTLPTLSLANNKKLKAPAYKLLAVFLRKATHLRYLDLSDNVLDKKAVDFLVTSLAAPSPAAASPPSTPSAPTASPSRSATIDSTLSIISSVVGSEGESVDDGSKRRVSIMPRAPLLSERSTSMMGSESGPGGEIGLATLRLDGCALRGASLEFLAQGVRTSTVKNISLRRNKISSLGGVAFAIMIKDIPDTAVQPTSTSNPFAAAPPSSSAITPSTSRPGTTNGVAGPTTTYSAYTPRRRQTQAVPAQQDDGPDLKPIPLVTTNFAGGVTKRTLPAGYSLDTPDGSDDEEAGPLQQGAPGGPTAHQQQQMAVGASMMQSRVRSLDDVTRMGRLVTLDLKGNDLRSGVGYIAQVLKRNRTLRVCNLAENKIDVAGLVSLAEALKYNSTLDTLDLSHNPCCGPGLEGITTLRTAFTINSNLKRLFLADTSLSTEGAIALAEFLPEARHLLHLDLTENANIDVAGIMALAVGLRSNQLLRCLDLSVPLNDEDVAALSQDILQSCIRNTELAQQKSTSKAARAAVWGPIQKSVIARTAKEADEARALAEANASAATPAGMARTAVFELSPEEVITSAEEVVQSLDESLEIQQSLGVVMDEVRGLIEKGKVLRERLEEIVQGTTDGDRLQVLLGLVDRLSVMLDKAIQVASAPSPPIRRVTGPPDGPSTPTQNSASSRARNDVTPTPGSRLGSSHSHQQHHKPPTPLSFVKQSHHAGLAALQVSTPSPSRNSSRPDAANSITSPNFSIADSDTDNSDADSDAEELTANPRQQSFKNIPLPDSPAVATFGASPTTPVGQEEEGETSEDEEEGDTSMTTEKSTNWIEEEGEVFRRGVKLMEEDAKMMEEEVSGEELRKEILETPLERAAPRRLSVDATSDDSLVKPSVADP